MHSSLINSTALGRSLKDLLEIIEGYNKRKIDSVCIFNSKVFKFCLFGDKIDLSKLTWGRKSKMIDFGKLLDEQDDKKPNFPERSFFVVQKV